jgi:hypothetical protein
MANPNTPSGLKAVRDAGSGKESGGLNLYFHPASDATALYIGDPVVKSGSADAAGVPGCVRAVAAGPITGIVEGFVPDGVTNLAGFGAASTAFYVLVRDDPSELFEIQEAAGMAAADIGLNANMAIAAGSAITKRSGVMLDAATKATTATLALKIVGLSPRPKNDFGAFNKLLVKINNHTEASGTAGIA